jgi:hypothetical protein
MLLWARALEDRLEVHSAVWVVVVDSTVVLPTVTATAGRWGTLGWRRCVADWSHATSDLAQRQYSRWARSPTSTSGNI